MTRDLRSCVPATQSLGLPGDLRSPRVPPTAQLPGLPCRDHRPPSKGLKTLDSPIHEHRPSLRLLRIVLSFMGASSLLRGDPVYVLFTFMGFLGGTL